VKVRQIGEGTKEISGKTVVNELLGEDDTRYLHRFNQTMKVGRVIADQHIVLYSHWSMLRLPMSSML
jgi:hypothetical protein